MFLDYSIAEYGTQPLIPSVSFEVIIYYNFIILWYTLQLGCPPSRCLVSLIDVSTEVTDIINKTEHVIEYKLSPFRHYELTAVVKNLRGKTKATYNTSICKIIIYYHKDFIKNLYSSYVPYTRYYHQFFIYRWIS